jgi:copper homeostasis protein CutC
MPGGGIRPENLANISSTIGTTEYHSAAITGGSSMPDKHAIAVMKQALHSHL